MINNIKFEWIDSHMGILYIGNIENLIEIKQVNEDNFREIIEMSNRKIFSNYGKMDIKILELYVSIMNSVSIGKYVSLSNRHIISVDDSLEEAKKSILEPINSLIRSSKNVKND